MEISDCKKNCSVSWHAWTDMRISAEAGLSIELATICHSLALWLIHLTCMGVAPSSHKARVWLGSISYDIFCSLFWYKDAWGVSGLTFVVFTDMYIGYHEN